MSPSEALELLTGGSLSASESSSLFRLFTSGALSDVQAAGLLAALKIRGETGELLHGAAEALLEAAVPFPRPGYPFADCCGTGGDGIGTVNISTAAMFVIAAGGVPVAKHGNHAISSRSGSTDVLSALGSEVSCPPALARASLDRCGIAYLHAPLYHPVLARLAPVRRELGTRTVFNLLGPLLNPARPPIRLIGVYAPSLVLPVARALARSGCASGLVVHGGGLDEIALHGPTTAARVLDGRVTSMTIRPEDAGLKRASVESLRGGTPAENAQWLTELLEGRGREDHAAAVAINAGAVLWLAGRAATLRAASSEALGIIRSGEALRRLRHFTAISHGT